MVIESSGEAFCGYLAGMSCVAPGKSRQAKLLILGGASGSQMPFRIAEEIVGSLPKFVGAPVGPLALKKTHVLAARELLFDRGF
jgi:hypothetical protein